MQKRGDQSSVNNPVHLKDCVRTERGSNNFNVAYNFEVHFGFVIVVTCVAGPHENTTTVTIYIVTDDNIITFKFENTLDAVVDSQLQVSWNQDLGSIRKIFSSLFVELFNS